MIAFFRKIRQRLLTENKVSRYILYAIGEIVLVVIGILIALAINNANELQQNTKKEKVVLQDLQSEYEQNQQQLGFIIKKLESQLKALKAFLPYFLRNPKAMDDSDFDVFIYNLGNLPEYVLAEDIMNSISNSGKISLISNRNLNYALAANSQTYEQYSKWMELNEKQVYDIILPYVMDKYPIKRVMVNFPGYSDVESDFKIETRQLLSDVRFESMVANRMLDMETVLKTARKLQTQQQTVLKLLAEELERLE